MLNFIIKSSFFLTTLVCLLVLYQKLINKTVVIVSLVFNLWVFLIISTLVSFYNLPPHTIIYLLVIFGIDAFIILVFSFKKSFFNNLL